MCRTARRGDTLQGKGGGNESLLALGSGANFVFIKGEKNPTVMYVAHGYELRGLPLCTSLAFFMVSKFFSDNELSLRDLH